MMDPRLKTLLFSSAIALMAGCRMYPGAETEQVLFAQTAAMVDQFEQDLVDARTTFGRLTASGAEDVSAHEWVLTLHEEVLATHRERLEMLSSSTSYRTLNRAFGAMMSEQKSVEILYQEAISGSSDSDNTMMAVAGSPGTLYAIYPVAYRAAESDERQAGGRRN